jgi:hypothetical protein
MIKKTITYTAFDDEIVTEDFYFHIKKSVLLENMDLKETLQDLQDSLTAEGRTEENLTEDEVKTLLELVKRLMKLSYGIRSEDGKKHRQTPEIWDDFYDSAAYDAILFQMFQEKGVAMAFLGGIMPKELMEEAEAEMRKQPQDRLAKHAPADTTVTTETVSFDEGDDEVRPQDETTEERRARLQRELAAMDVNDQPQH